MGTEEQERALIAQLSSRDERTRLRAAEALAAAPSPAGSAALAGALADESWRVRRVAVEGLAQRGGAEVIERLLRLLRDSHRAPGILNSVLQVLALLEENVVARLAEYLADPEPELRAYAALALGEQQRAEAIPPLLQALDDPDANVCYHVIEALGRLRALEAVEALMQVAEGEDSYLAFAALDALAYIGDASIAPRLVPLLTNEWLHLPATRALGELGDEHAVAPLVALLNTPESPVPPIAEALLAIHDRYEMLYQEGRFIAELARAAISGRGIQQLLSALEQAQPDRLRPLVSVVGWLDGSASQRALARLLDQPSVHQEVIRALSRQGSRVTELLIEQIEQGGSEARRAAALALGRIGDRRALPALIGLLSAEAEVAIVAIGALAKLGDQGAFEPLLGLIGHPSGAVRQAAISALNSLGNPQMASRVSTLLADDNPLVRESAARIAGYFGYPESAEPLLRCCQDPDEGVRRAAVEHLPFLEDARATPTLLGALAQGSAAVRAAAAHALAHVEEEIALPALLAALQQDEEPRVRYHAARSLGRQGASAALDALGRAAGPGESMLVRLAAIEALGRVGGEQAVAYLTPFLGAEEPDLVRAAQRALEMIGHEVDDAILP